MKRIITGVLLIAAVAYMVLWGPAYALVAASLLIAMLGLWEFYRLCEETGVAPVRVTGYLLVVAFCWILLADGGALRTLPFGLFIAWSNVLAALALAAVIWLALSLLPGMSHLRLLRSPRFATLLGAIYVSIPLYLLVWLRWQESPVFLLFALAVIWAGDTTAYFIGKNFGKHKSSPNISPNKTWEGTIASFVAALLAGLIAARYFLPDGYWELLALSAALNIAGQLGDLAESGLKRSAGVKDSSHLVPGHGGILDRIDAVLFAAPVLWYYWLWFKA